MGRSSDVHARRGSPRSAVEFDQAVNQLLAGKLKLGAGVSAAAGPSGTQASGFNHSNVDILTYARSEGLFAGASLGEASMTVDAVKHIEWSADGNSIVTDIAPPANSLVSLLGNVSPSRTSSGARAIIKHSGHAGYVQAPIRPVKSEDEILEEALNDLHNGKMLYNTPEKLKTAQTGHVLARIAPNSLSPQAMKAGLPSDQETRTETTTTPISAKMKMTLKGADFDIVPLSSEEQIVGGDKPTTWEWDITPKRSGKLRLHLAAIVELHSISRDFTTVDKEITVEVDPIGEAAKFVKENWHWILTTIGAGIAAIWAWWKRRKKPNVPDWETP